jgi:carbamoyltransferase
VTAILGVSAFYHDSAAALVIDGDIVAAAQEERFSRKKHDHGFPLQAIGYCLREAQLEPEDLDYVGFYDKPLLKFDRLLETYLAYAPRGLRSFLRAMPLWLKEKLHVPRELAKGLGGGYRKRFIFTEHHEAHAASAFFPSPFDEAAILTMDGVGEWATASYGVGRQNRIELTHELRFPHSLGLLYSAFTAFTGFRVNSGEHKLMGLAPYGEPRHAGLILEKLMDLKDDGSFRLDMSYFNYCQGLTMTGPKLARLLGRPPRRPEAPITQDDMDLAASIQKVTEEVMLRAARHVHAETGERRLCLAGGVALNCVANGRILREGPFGEVWVQPAAGDAGGALGAALFIWHQLLGGLRAGSGARGPRGADIQKGSFLGPTCRPEEIRAELDRHGARYRRFEVEDDLCRHVAGLIADGKVVGWVAGRMEFGPRALGGRSILADSRRFEVRETMNRRIKRREPFRPFAPSVLRERASEFFEMRPDEESAYMLFVAPVRAEKRLPLSADARRLEGLDKLSALRSVVPAVTHVDFSARVQTVDPVRHGRYHRLLKAFEEKTGCPVIINTSFNVRGEPIVSSPEQAYRAFMAMGLDALVLEDFVVLRDEQAGWPQDEVEAHVASFPAD